MKKMKRSGSKILALLMAFTLLTGQLANTNLIYAEYLDGYVVTDSTDSGLSVPGYLEDGEIWTGKSAVHNGDGTVTVTLSV